MGNVDAKVMKSEITNWLEQAAINAKADVKEKLDTSRKYYVYALCEKRDDKLIPFYIGKGTSERVWEHEEGQKKEEERIRQEYSDEELEQRLNDMSAKYKKIEQLGADNIEKIFIKIGLTEYESFMCESVLINLFRRPGLAFEDSDALTNIVNGHVSVVEKHENISTEARTVDEFYKLCKEPIIVNKMTEQQVLDFKGKRILLQNINRYYWDCLSVPRKEQNNAIRETGRAFWFLNKTFRDESGNNYNFDYVFVMFDSRIVGVYKLRDVCTVVKGKKEFYTVLDLWQQDYPRYDIPVRNKDLEFAKVVYDECISKGIIDPSHPEKRISQNVRSKLYSTLSPETQRKIRDFIDADKKLGSALKDWIEKENISLDNIDASAFSRHELEVLNKIAVEYVELNKKKRKIPLSELFYKLTKDTQVAYRELIKDTPEMVKCYNRKMSDLAKRQYFVLDDISESDSSNFTSYVGCRIYRETNGEKVKIFVDDKYKRGFQPPVQIVLDGTLNY